MSATKRVLGIWLYDRNEKTIKPYHLIAGDFPLNTGCWSVPIDPAQGDTLSVEAIEKINHFVRSLSQRKDVHPFELRLDDVDSRSREVIVVPDVLEPGDRWLLFLIGREQYLNSPLIRETEAHYRSVVAAMAEGAVMQDRSGAIISCNKSAEQALGLTADQLAGRTSIDPRWRAITEDGAEFPGEQHPAMVTLRTGQPQRNVVMGVQKPDGVLSWISINTQPIFISDDDKPDAVVASFHDITDQKRAFTALGESEKRFRLFVNHVADGLFIHDDTGRIFDVNKAASDLLDYSRAELLRMNVVDFELDFNLDMAQGLWQQMTPGEPVTAIGRHRRKDGSVFPVEVRVTLFEYEGKKRFLASVRDYTERKAAEEALRASEERFELAVRGTNDGLWDWNLETNAVFYSERFEELLGYNPGEFGTSFEALETRVHPKDIDTLHRAISEHLATRSVFDTEFRLKTKNGKYRWFQGRGRAVWSAEAKPTRMAGSLKDITDRKKAEAALFEEKEKLHATLHSIGDGVITTDVKGIIDYMNPVAVRLTGVSAKVAHGKPLNEIVNIVDEHNQLPIRDPVEWCLSEGGVVSYDEHALLSRDDHEHYAVKFTASPIRSYTGHVTGVVLALHDTTPMWQMARQLSYQATHDALTGLINRREFELRLNHALETARVGKATHALCFLDLDQFKVVNDTRGHAAGDQLLKQLVSVLESVIRGNDSLARLGGDEFGLLLEGCDLAKASEIAEKIRGAIEKFRFVWEDAIFQIGVSIGLVMINKNSGFTREILSAADAACYAAKQRGRNRVYVYHANDSMLKRHQGEIEWARVIKDALANDRFVLYGQRIRDMNNHRNNRRFEILIRMLDTRNNVVMPKNFLPAAERFNLMPSIDRWVVTRTLQLIEGNPVATRDTVFNVNVSGQSLSDETFVDFVVKTLGNSKVNGAQLCFEVTETAAVADLNNANRFFSRLKKMGCTFALDDFGSGLSSFAYLKTMPVDYLKIDGIFIRDIIEDPLDNAMVNSINEIGHLMGIQTIAEFVEREEVLQQLNQVNVDYVQGLHIHTPQPVEDCLTQS